MGASTDKHDDFELGIGFDDYIFPIGLADDVAVQFNGNPLGVYAEMFEQSSDVERGRDLFRVAIYFNKYQLL